jgi:hypothetical protein
LVLAAVTEVKRDESKEKGKESRPAKKRGSFVYNCSSRVWLPALIVKLVLIVLLLSSLLALTHSLPLLCAFPTFIQLLTLLVALSRWSNFSTLPLLLRINDRYLKNIRKATKEGGSLGLASLQGENRIMEQVVAAFKKTEEQAFIANATTAKTIAEDFINYIWTTRGEGCVCAV